MLFNEILSSTFLADQNEQIENRIRSLEPNYVLAVSEEDFVASLVQEFTLDIPVLNEADIQMDHNEQQISVGVQQGHVFSLQSHVYAIGTSLTVFVPFLGAPGLFDVQPSRCTVSYRHADTKIVDHEIHITFSGVALTAVQAKNNFDEELGRIRQNLEYLTSDLSRHNGGLEGRVRALIRQRKTKLLNDAHIAASLGIPIRRRDGMPVTYSVPVKKRRPRIERPNAPSAPFQPEPVLAMSEYEDILEIIRNMVRVMEQSPRAFVEMGEEDLRTHFLVQLNGQYEGRATGETFNYQGKTDILIREDDRNIFIAECKFWAGEKQFSETIEQLLSYLSWRDTKTAILIFNRNKDFSGVLKKIEESTPKHKNYKRMLSKVDESTFRYLFHQPNDRNRELILTVLAFDIPKELLTDNNNAQG